MKTTLGFLAGVQKSCLLQNSSWKFLHVDILCGRKCFSWMVTSSFIHLAPPLEEDAVAIANISKTWHQPYGMNTAALAEVLAVIYVAAYPGLLSEV